MKEYKFKAKFLRKLPNPYEEFTDGKKNPELYELLVDIKQLPEEMNMETNPRFQNMKTGVVKKIKTSLLTDDKSFFLKNRGILLSVKSIKYNNITGEVLIVLEDLSVHGCVDGGHTFAAIQQVREKISHSHFVRLEVMTGIEECFEDVAAARNTSAPVPERAIAELKKNFNFIKEFIKNEPFINNIAFKENDDEKNIEMNYLISLLFMFNIDRFNGQSVPTQACSNVQSCMNDFLKEYKKHEENIEENPYYKLKNIIVDIFKLHDKLQKNMSSYYKQYFTSGRYGQVKGVILCDGHTTFYEEDMSYITPKGLLFPILGSLRALVGEKNGLYFWQENPYDYLDKLGKDLVGEAIERHRSLGNSATNVGKDSNHWKQLYRNVLTELLLERQNIN